MNSSSWRLEGVDGGDEQYPVESRFTVRHNPPDEQDPRFDHSAPTQVCFVRFAVCYTPPDQQGPRFVRFAVRHTPPDQQDPVLNVAGRTQGRILRSAIRQASFPSPVSSKPVGSHAFGCLPMNTTHSVASP